MDTIRIYRTADNEFRITNIVSLSSRNQMKFNILLNSLSESQVRREADDIFVRFMQTENLFIAKALRQIVNYLSELKHPVSIEDKSTSTLLQHLESHECSAKERLTILQNLGKIQSEVPSDFLGFCNACDSCLKIKLRDYQYEAAFHLVKGMGGFDFSVPGAGKTIITYTAYDFLKKDNVVEQILVIGPTSSYNAWYDEYCTCFGKEPDFENLSEYSVKLCKVYFTSSRQNHKEITFVNIEKLRLLSREIDIFMSTGKIMLVIDEAHKIKNPSAKATIAALFITQSAGVRVALTGTPMPNGYEDLFSLAKFISPFVDILPYNYARLKAFTQNYASNTDIQLLRESIRPYFTRISKKFLLEKKELLPSLSENVECDMLDEQRLLYTQLDKFRGKISDDMDQCLLAALKKAILIRKMQISANPALLKKSIVASMDELRVDALNPSCEDDIAKLAEADRVLMKELSSSDIMKIINAFDSGKLLSPKNVQAVQFAAQLLERGEQVLIWDIFVKNMFVLKHMLEKILNVKVGMINGVVSFAERQHIISHFKDGSYPILLANPATLAESISLHRVCQHAIYVNRNFNAAQFIQSKDRIHRINMPQGKTAHYLFVLNSDSVDVIVDERLKIKEKRMLAILDADDIEIGGAEFEDTSIMSQTDIEQGYVR